MAKVRQLFNGIEIEVAQRKRICHHNRAKHSIARGERCVVIKNDGGVGAKNYCLKCGAEIFDRADKDLAGLRKELSAET